MIRILKQAPECFRDVTTPHLFIEGYDHDGPYAHLAVEFSYNVAGFHLHVCRWSPDVLRCAKRDWFDVLDLCEAEGATQMLAQNTNLEDARWPKLIRHFGFPKPLPVAISSIPIKEARALWQQEPQSSARRS